jgi:hypothetical protein
MVTLACSAQPKRAASAHAVTARNRTAHLLRKNVLAVLTSVALPRTPRDTAQAQLAALSLALISSQAASTGRRCTRSAARNVSNAMLAHLPRHITHLSAQRVHVASSQALGLLPALIVPLANTTPPARHALLVMLASSTTLLARPLATSARLESTRTN